MVADRPVIPARNLHGVTEAGFIPDLFLRINLMDLYPHKAGCPKMLRCPVHDDGTPSYAVYPTNAHCHAGDCGFHETVVEHIWRVCDCGTRSQVAPGKWLKGWPKFFHIARKLIHNEPVVVEDLPPPPLDPTLPDKAHATLLRDPGAEAWLQAKYGFTHRTVVAACLGHTGRNAFTLPIRGIDCAYLTTKFRRDDRRKMDGEKYFSLKGHGQTRLYLPPGIRGQGSLADIVVSLYGKRIVVLTEGEFDALALWQVGIPAVSFTSGAKSIISGDQHLLAAFDGLDGVWVAYDMDDAGQENAVRVVQLLEERGVPARRLVWRPTLGKDSAELVRRGFTKDDFRAAWIPM